MWTSPATRGYMVVTCHWIDSNWALQNAILRFVRVEYPHTSVSLARQLFDAVNAYGLVGRIVACTGDNASTNQPMIEEFNNMTANELEDMLEQDMGVQECANFRSDVQLVRCLAHTLQLSVIEGIKKMPKIESSIGHFRQIIKHIHESPKLREVSSNKILVIIYH